MPTASDVSSLSLTVQSGSVANYIPGEAHNSTDATNLIDGTADLFYPADGGVSASAMAVAYYNDSASGQLAIKYILWQMPSSQVALNFYNALPSEDSLYAGMTVTEPVGDQARVSPGTYPHMNVVKGIYLLDMSNEAINLTDDQMTQFATVAANKIH
jgi:hypothetical protein